MQHEELRTLLATNEEWLMERILRYATDHGYTAYTSTLVEAWRLSISGLSTALVNAALADPEPPEFAPNDDYAANPIAAFGVLEAHRHRKRGIAIGMFLGLFKYYRQTYLDLLDERIADPKKRLHYALFVTRCFDLFELALCQEWAETDVPMQIAEMQDANRHLANEKNRYLTLFESISDPAFLVDPQGKALHMNLAATNFLRIPLSPGELYYAEHLASEAPLGHNPHLGIATIKGTPLSELLPWLGEQMDSFLLNNRTVMRLETNADCFGQERHFKVTLSKLLDISGKFSGAVAILNDVTTQKQTEYALIESEQDLTKHRDLLSLIIDGTPALISYVDRDLRYQFANAYYKDIFSIAPQELIGLTVKDIIGEEAFATAWPYYQATLAGKPQSFELPYTLPTGRKLHLIVNYIPHVVQGQVVGIIALVLNETERRQAESERQRFFDVSLDMLCVAGIDGRFKKMNAAWTRTLGWSKEELMGKTGLEFIHPEDIQRTILSGQNLANGQNVVSFENRWRCKNGSYKWITWNSIPLPEEGLIYSVAHDTTTRRELEDKLKRLATKDSLTGINNRRNFMELATRELHRAERYERPVAMLMIDIDHFKRVNDTHGHPAGDEVLRRLVHSISMALRKTDVLGRIGGEEFASLLPETELENALQTAERIRSDVEKLEVRYEKLTIRFTISIGLASSHNTKETLDSLLKRADDALYEAKRTGRNRVIAAATRPD